jgi:hypothetical protein
MSGQLDLIVRFDNRLPHVQIGVDIVHQELDLGEGLSQLHVPATPNTQCVAVTLPQTQMTGDEQTIGRTMGE